MTRFLEGDVLDPQAQRITDLEKENRDLRRQRDDAQLEAERAREDAARALSRLRTQLSPLYRALQAVFGELDAAGVVETATGSVGTGQNATAEPAMDPRISAVWENWKSKLPGYPARIIDALLLHRDMNTQQLAIAVGCKRQRISEGIVKLNQAGLINKNGGRFSLKAL